MDDRMVIGKSMNFVCRERERAAVPSWSHHQRECHAPHCVHRHIIVKCSLCGKVLVHRTFLSVAAKLSC